MTPAAFVALDRQRVAELRAGRHYSGPAHAATPALLAAHDLSPGEEADYTALAYAGVSALERSTDALRMVVAVEPASAQVRDLSDELGLVELSEVRWQQVGALFADEATAAPVIAEARALAAGRSVAQLLDDPVLERLLDSVDLLWFAREELDLLPLP